ncbi:MAG: helix-turn-helix domain-containing protein [Bacteroidota bacterium]
MNARSQNAKIIFGLKVKQLRREKGLSFSDLKDRSGLSVSYLNEIEKGKKYPKKDKIATLAAALGTNEEELTSPNLTRSLAPVGELLRSNFLNELPLDLFGIELTKVVEIIANAPMRVGAFISTLVELARNYALQEENFYHGAMRAYQEMHYNYFEEIELAVDRFIDLYDVPSQHIIQLEMLYRLLEDRFNYKIVEDGLKPYPALHHLRSIFVPKQRQLLLHGGLSNIQKAFQVAKELGFQFLDLKDRAITASLTQVNSFEEVLNHFKASYFAVALLIRQHLFVEDLRNFFNKSDWDGEAFLQLKRGYQASPEMLFQRLTNVIPRFFGLRKMFFLRFIHEPETGYFQTDKELHLNRQHHPHGNRINEHYCRRWLSLSLLKDLYQIQQEGKYVGTIVGAQRSKYFGTEDEYLCFTLARPAYPTPNQNISVTLGFLIDEDLRKTIHFLDDPKISTREVNRTCERCPFEDCEERAVPATIVEKKKERKRVQDALQQILNK